MTEIITAEEERFEDIASKIVFNDYYVKDNLLISERRLVFKESSTSPLAKETEAQVFFLFQSSN